MTGMGDLVERFDHVAYAVRSIRSLLPLVDLLGGSFHGGGDNHRGGFRWVQFDMPGTARLEVIEPIAADCFLHAFLAKRGEGIHHLTYKVSDVEEAARRAEGLGFETAGLWTASTRWQEVFLPPRSAHGTVIQLAAWDDPEGPGGVTLESVLAGEVPDHA